MKLAVVTVRNAATRGGAELLYDGLVAALHAGGHLVDRVELQSDESTYESILDAYRAASALDLAAYDAVISTKAPSYNIHHPRHILYLVHTIRVFYDMFESWTDGSTRSRAQRDHIRELDFQAFSRVPDERRFAIGEEVAIRLRDSLGLSAAVLHPGLTDADRFHEGPSDHFLHAGRLHHWKRAGLVLSAFLSLPDDIPLIIAGAGDEEESLRRRAAGDPRVRFVGEVPRAELYSLFSRALAVPFVPIREDFGYVALEAMAAGKPVITATDSGEPARLIGHERNGLIAEPHVDSVAAAMSRVLREPELARRMGAAGKIRAARIRWPTVIRRLLEPQEASPRKPAVRRTADALIRVLVVDNQPIEPPIGGGRLRLSGLYSNLPSDLKTTYVGSYDWPGPGYRGIVHHGRLLEVTVPQSEAHFQVHDVLRNREPTLTMDATFPFLSHLSPGFVDRVLYEASRADVIVCSHPWVFPIITRAVSRNDVPIIYDAQNVEGVLKRKLIAASPLGEAVAADLQRIERELCARASAILACSANDARQFADLYGVPASRLHVVPNGVDSSGIHASSPAEKVAARESLGIPPGTLTAVFVGSHYPPNAEAAEYIAGPLAAALPDVLFLLVGGCALDFRPGATPSNVKVLGVVADALRNTALAAADLAVNPMSQGSGTNIKMLDFFAAGLATVTTPVGARGFAEGSSRCCLVVSREDFALAIRRLARDADLRSQIGSEARQVAESRYDWRHLSSIAAQVIRDTVSSFRTRGRRSLPVKFQDSQPLVAIMSTWKTRCGIAGYTEFLAGALPKTLRWKVYAEATSCGVPEDASVRRNWRYGLPETESLLESLRRDHASALLIQYHAAFFGEQALAGLLQRCRVLRLPVGVTFHVATGLRMTEDVARELGRVARIFVHRQTDADWFARFGVRAPVRVTPQGIARFPRRSATAVKQALGLGGATVVGHFGYLRQHKGTLKLIEAYDRLAGSAPGLHLLLVCSEYPSEDSKVYLRACADRIARSNYRDRIHASFAHLPVAEVAYLLQACDLIVFPYEESEESASAAVRLALAVERPILVSQSRIFEDLEGSAETLPSLSPEDMAARITEVLREPERLARSSQRLARFVAARLWPRIAALTWGSLKPQVTLGPE